MSGGMEALCLRLLDLARKQKAAVEAGNIDEAMSLSGDRHDVLAELRKTGCGPGKGEPEVPASVIREILSIDRIAMGVVEAEKLDISDKLSRINTFKVLCGGAVDGARARGLASGT